MSPKSVPVTTGVVLDDGDEHATSPKRQGATEDIRIANLSTAVRESVRSLISGSYCVPEQDESMTEDDDNSDETVEQSATTATATSPLLALFKEEKKGAAPPRRMPPTALSQMQLEQDADLKKFDAFGGGNDGGINGGWSSSQTDPSKTHKHVNISKVERSWYLISQNLDEVGLKFFLRMFDEYPELVKLFPFGEDDFDARTRKLKLNASTRRHVRAHASAVMRVVGTCVAGLTSIEELVPRLRNVGATHKTVGVREMHYDILYRHLMRAIREEVGTRNWDQETEDAWEQAFVSITDLIKRPSKRLETEPLHGWGVVMLLACTYFMIVTPFRFAGFLYGRPQMVVLLDTLDALASFVLFLDLMIDFVQSKLRIRRLVHGTGSFRDLLSLEKSDESSQTTLMDGIRNTVRQMAYKQRIFLVKTLQKYQMDRWVPWPSLDMKVLISFPLQYMYVRTSICSQIGLHWTQLFGLMRMLTVRRVLHFVQCAENNAVLEQKLNADRQVQLRIVKLLFQMAFIIHYAACLWCIVARVQLGVDAAVFEPTPFFPSSDVVYGTNNNVWNSYSRAVHWAFVNLSGIGGVDSHPVSSLECWTLLAAHITGALFFAIVTGNVIAILEERTSRDSKIGSDIMRLSAYMKTARVSAASKDRIMKGYMMRNVLTEATEGGITAVGGEGLDPHDDVLSTLPTYLRMEVGIYARAEMIRRCNKFFSHCSNGFLVALSSSLSRTRTLLSGDYLMQEGEQYTPEFLAIESGSLQVRKDQHTIKTLKRGDCIGRAWLLHLNSIHHKNPNAFSEETDWLRKDGTAGVSIRALSPCLLLTGLSTRREINDLKAIYAVDFKLLGAEARNNTMDEAERKAIAMKGIAKAVRRFKARRAARNALENNQEQQKHRPQTDSQRSLGGSLDSGALKRLVEQE